MREERIKMKAKNNKRIKKNQQILVSKKDQGSGN